MRNILTLLTLLCLIGCVPTLVLSEQEFYQTLAEKRNEDAPPKREFRGVWVATVANIDFPSAPGLPNNVLKTEWDELLDYVEEFGFNAVIVQIRPAGDALYPTELAPWSYYLTGEQGKAPLGEFDPLQYMLETTHERGMEFHAWLNPYRATMNLDTSRLAADHRLRSDPDWFLTYGKKIYFNPALPEVRQHIVDVVGEVVDRYNVDAIHFDDYFYPYKIKDTPFPDDTDFTRYGGGFTDIADWRRSNTDSLILGVKDRIRNSKPWVQFGISPFGVWRNASVDPIDGSPTRAGQTSYDDLYADILKWLREGWIDYVAPQLYWSIDYPLADYETLVYWWGNHTYGRNLYIGQAGYKVGDNPVAEWNTGNEIGRQLNLNRNISTVDGTILFSLRSLRANSLNFADSLRLGQYGHPALHPRIKTPQELYPEPPEFEKIKAKKGRLRLKWESESEQTAAPEQFIIYRFDGADLGDFSDPRNILRITDYGNREEWIEYDDTAIPGRTYTYAVTAYNWQHNESPVRLVQTVTRRDNGKVKRLGRVEVE